MVSPVKPPALRPGDTIGVAALSGPVDTKPLEAGIAALRGKGYRVIEASNLRRRTGFLAGTDAQRAEGYRALVEDPQVAAIFFARGGYGAGRVLSRLDPREIAQRPKIHLGGSDLTALFAFLHRHAGLVTFYGPMVAVEMAEDSGELDWERVLHGGSPPPHRFAEEEIASSGSGRGPLVGGCLSLVASLAGTPDAVRGSGTVFFWEDVGEELYRLDRMLTQLERSGTFDGLQAMVIGSVAPGARGGRESADAVRRWLRLRFAGAPFPVAFGLPAGHVRRPRTLPLGATVALDADRGVLEFETAAVV